jgi:predicted transcriptional regulator
MKTFTDEEIRRELKSMIDYDYRIQDLGDEIGLTQSHISKILSGKSGINQKVLDFLGYERIIVARMRDEK